MFCFTRALCSIKVQDYPYEPFNTMGTYIMILATACFKFQDYDLTTEKKTRSGTVCFVVDLCIFPTASSVIEHVKQGNGSLAGNLRA